MATIQDKHVETTVVAVFDSLPAAEGAIESLRVAGFLPEQLNVISTVQAFQERFPTYQPPAGPGSWKSAAIWGSGVGGVLAGVATATLLANGTGLPILFVGTAAGMLTGGIVGALAGVMAERGFEPDAVDYYVMAVSEGRCLLSVDILGGEDVEARVAQAVEVLEKAGAEPVQLPGEFLPGE